MVRGGAVVGFVGGTLKEKFQSFQVKAAAGRPWPCQEALDYTGHLARAPPNVNTKAPRTMSASYIPDLRTLLVNRRGGEGRGRGRGRGVPGTAEGQSAIKDSAVRATDQDAAGSRVSCVELGYLHDPYANCFSTQPSVRRLPLLNRGMVQAHKHCHPILTMASRDLHPHIGNRSTH
jgi:hypothetical protein